jgi:capsular exopolysaccharide synthesis family protein
VSQESEEPNIARAIGFLRRRGLWIIVCLVLAIAGAYGLSRHQTKKYTATASLVFSDNQLSQEIAGLPSTGESAALQQSSNLELLQVGDMAEETAAILRHGLTAAKVEAGVSISGQPESSVAGVSATMTSAKLAAEVANTYAQQFVLEDERTSRHFFRSALHVVRKQLAALTPAQRVGTDGLELQNRVQTLELLAGLEPNTVQVAQRATVPTSPSYPRTFRDLLIAAILGLVIGLGLAVLLERLDPRIRNPRELEAIYGLPLLGSVPRSRALAKFTPADDEPGALPPADAEAFHLIRSRLRSFNSGRSIRVVLITSAEPGEGKTTIARHLAGAAARMGSSVLLIEANLGKPILGRQLELAPSPGLADVLTGAVSLATACQPLTPPRVGSHALRLNVLPSGPGIPINRVELIESHAMNALLDEAQSSYDLIVIDAPELASVSDTFLLAAKVDGVVIVSRVGQSRRDVAARLSQVLRASDAPLVGVIADGVKPSRRDPARTPERPDASTVADRPRGDTAADLAPTAKG